VVATVATTEEENVMKKTVRNFVMLVAVALAVTGLALAHDPLYRVTANIPFDFYAGDEHFPSGEYQFVVNEDNSVILADTTSRRTSVVLATPGDAVGNGNGGPALYFDEVGNTHVLVNLRTYNAGLNFPQQNLQMVSAKRGKSVAIVASLR